MHLADLTGHGAIVTGGASGLGAATAGRLAQDGLGVAMFGINEATGRAHAEKIAGHFFPGWFQTDANQSLQEQWHWWCQTNANLSL